MSVNSYLSGLASELVLSGTEKRSISTSIETLKRRLDYYFIRGEIEESFIFGSYTRDTILPRKYDEDSDIDVMIVFDNPNRYKPQTFLSWLKRFAEERYQTSEIYQSSPTIVLELDHIKFELVPAYKELSISTSYKIPDGPSQWQLTTPREDDDKLIQCNKANDYLIKPVVRLIKLWNIKKNNRNDKSFLIERKIADWFYYHCNNYTDYLKESLRSIRTHSNYTNIGNAMEGIDEALEYEERTMPYSALEKIKEIFPES